MSIRFFDSLRPGNFFAKPIVIFLSFLFIVQFSYAKVVPLDEIPENATKVTTGMYLMNIYDMNMETNSFYADFYIWFKWQGDIDPVNDFEFINYIEKWGHTEVVLYDEPITIEKNNYKYQFVRFESRFFHPFSLQKYPLDSHKLSIQLENFSFSIDSIVYIADNKYSDIRKDLIIPGWEISDLRLDERLHIYDTKFGTPGETGRYSNLNFNFTVKRPISYFIWKLMLPLIVVLISSWGASLIFPGFVDARISLPMGALVTAVFLQQSYASKLPAIGYLILMDKIYALAYLLIVLGLVQTIVTANWTSVETEEAYRRVHKFDVKTLVFMLGVFITGTTVFIYFG